MMEQIHFVEFLDKEWDPQSRGFTYTRNSRSQKSSASSHSTSIINTNKELHPQMPSMNKSPVTLYKCRVCRRAYMKQVNLEKHERTHEELVGEMKNNEGPSPRLKSKPGSSQRDDVQEDIEGDAKGSTRYRSENKATLRNQDEDLNGETTSTVESRSLPKSSDGDEVQDDTTTPRKSNSSPISCDTEQVQEDFTKITGKSQSKDKPELYQEVQVEAINSNTTSTKASKLKPKLKHRNQVEKKRNKNMSTTKSMSSTTQNSKSNTRKRSQPTTNLESMTDNQAGLDYLNPEIERKVRSAVIDNCRFEQDTEMFDSIESNTAVMEWCSAETNSGMFDITQQNFKAFLKPARENVKMEHEQLDDVQSQVNNILNFLNTEEEVDNETSEEYELEAVIPETELDVNQQKNSSPAVQMDSDRDEESEEFEEMEDFSEEKEDVSEEKEDAVEKKEDGPVEKVNSDEKKEDISEEKEDVSKEKGDTGEEKDDANEEKKGVAKASGRGILKVKITKKSKEIISKKKKLEDFESIISKKRVPVIKLLRIPKEKMLEDYKSSISKESTPMEEHSRKANSKTDLIEKDGDLKSCSSEDDFKNEDLSDNDGSDYIESDNEDVKVESSETENKNVTEHKAFNCFLCGEKFLSKGKMEYHRRKHNFPLWPLSVGKGANCDECGKMIKSRSALLSHKRTHLPKMVKKVKCNICKKAFSEALHLRQHVCSKERKVKHICEICGSTFNRRGCLNEHMLKEHDDKTYDCEQCGKSFKHPSNLRKHVKIHSKEKSFICDLCGQGFTFSGTLHRHMKVHLDSKPFKCITCGKFFRTNYNLNSHMLTHTKERPFRCDLCPEAYNHKISLQLHVRKCHHYDLV
ncbi:zinc finger protein 37-like [Saccostrea echinata]|uniref:zinc finger protein 37-like n=1 Tax=Saccostrea echinata TaxID=191078 RepID=UPI002A80414D|nr:zinc finger protein 37-like [Saccostrea echinata]